ncbi:hypothetical protein CCACVL1_21338 [Corchorus capsularis]|uniref:Uncharacterized protein n=1 Tax=Corchorus capsularis TaxID=210143 RepID=A0A1R3H6H2_COCAP|nr:hypothetical protein CCACVL1_21338 [Corchorus capsularis]
MDFDSFSVSSSRFPKIDISEGMGA